MHDDVDLIVRVAAELGEHRGDATRVVFGEAQLGLAGAAGVRADDDRVRRRLAGNALRERGAAREQDGDDEDADHECLCPYDTARAGRGNRKKSAISRRL